MVAYLVSADFSMSWVAYVVHAQVGQVLVVQAQQGLAVDVVLDHQVRVLALVQVVEPSAGPNRRLYAYLLHDRDILLDGDEVRHHLRALGLVHRQQQEIVPEA